MRSTGLVPDPLGTQQLAEDRRWMARALRLAMFAARVGEVPVGAVLIHHGRLLAVGCNRPIGQHDPSAHAEIMALRRASRRIGNYRLTGTTLYVTLEPCVMCVGALIHARIARLVFAAHEPRTGAVDSRWQLLAPGLHNHQISVTAGVLADQSAALLQTFFRARRR